MLDVGAYGYCMAGHFLNRPRLAEAFVDAGRLVILALVVCGCGGSISVTHVLTGPPLAEKPPGTSLPVYFNQPPPRPYREIAQIRVRATSDEATLDGVLGAATEDARALGADAVIADLRYNYHSVEVSVDCDARPSVPASVRLNARVTAIVFITPDAASPEAEPQGPPPRQICGRGGGS